MYLQLTNLVQLIITLSLLVNQVCAYNILIWSAFGARSHRISLEPILEELGKRGHYVTNICSSKDDNTIANVTDVFLPDVYEVMNSHELSFFSGDANRIMELIKRTMNIQIPLLYSSPLIKGIIDNPRDPKTNAPKYDVVIIDATFNEHGLPIAHLMDVPVIYISTTILFTHLAWSLNIPFPTSYVPTGMSILPKVLSFTERATNSLQAFLYNRAIFSDVYPSCDKAIRDILPNIPTIEEMQRKSAFVITNDHPTLTGSAPTMPYHVQLGGLHCRPAKKLPKDLEDFMESSGENGVIYFSLGTFAKQKQMPTDLVEKLLDALKQVPQKIIWKIDKTPPDLPPNIKTVQWAPQQDILGHPKVRLFISHGGMLSTQEASYHGCPLLGFPLSVDQLGNIGHAIRLGFADHINWRELTTKELINKITNIIGDKRYKENAMKVSRLFKDRPDSPVKSAAYWIEYVIRHKGAPHLRSGADHLNFFQYFLLDIITLVLVACGLVLLLAIYAIRVLFRLATRQASSKPQTKTNKKD